MVLSAQRAPIVRREVSALWQLAWPILIGQLATVGMNVADVAMAGHASALDLAGVALGVSVWHIAIVTLMGLFMAVNAVVAQHVGAREPGRIGHVVRQALWQALGVGVLAIVAANAAALVFAHLNVEPSVRALAKDFVWVIGFALPAFCGYRVLYGYSASLDQTRPMMVIALLALALNIVVNWLLVFGKLGFPRLGGLGCAWATLACVWFELVAIVWWIRRAPAYRDSTPFTHYEPPRWDTLRSLFALGIPMGITYFAETSAFSLIALLVAVFGSTQVAAHQIALNFCSLLFMLPLSLGIASLTRVGQALGAQQPAEARSRAWIGVALAIATGLAAAIVMVTLNHAIAGFYTSDLAVAALAAQLLLISALFQISDVTQVSAACAVRAYKVTRLPMVIHLFSFWGLALPLGCVLGLAPEWFPWRPAQPMGARGFWIGLVVGLSFAAIALVIFLDRLANRHVRAARLAAGHNARSI